jgi:hypothetical protein
MFAEVAHARLDRSRRIVIDRPKNVLWGWRPERGTPWLYAADELST